MSNNTSGFSNTAIGESALKSNTAGDRNIAIGAGSLSFNTIGKSMATITPSNEYMNGELLEIVIFNTDISVNQISSLNTSYSWTRPTYVSNIFGTNPAIEFGLNSSLNTIDVEKSVSNLTFFMVINPV